MVFICRTSNGVKKVLWMLVVIVGFVALPAHAADLSFTKFNSDITVNTDASISVVETMTVDFSSPLHGIYRNIPFRFSTLSGGQASIPIAVSNVTQDSQPVPYALSTVGNDVKIKIGDSSKTVSGSHEYTISYTAQAATNFFSDHDELYWNVTGTDWDAPVTNITSTVRLPSTFLADRIQTACYTGPPGSTAQNCQRTHTASQADFGSQEFLTIVVGWPTGAVTKPADYDRLRAAGTQTPSPFTSAVKGWWLVANILLPLLALVVMFQLWWTRGRDPGKHRTIVAQYDPPDGLRPVELYCLMHERAPAKALAATIVDLAVRGYIKIIQTEKSTMLGLSHKDDYILRSLKAPDSDVRPFERELLELLFVEHLYPASKNDLRPISNNDLRLSDLKKRKYTNDPFAPIFRQIVQQVVTAGYFQGNPSTVRGLWVLGGVLMGGLGGLALYIGWPLVGLIAAGLIVLIFSGAMPRRTTKGVETTWVGHGFKLFLEKAEKYRIQWQERENIFEAFLPYAMIFGIADKWSKALSDVVKTNPTWYEGQPGAAFNTMVFWGAMSSFGSSVNTSVVSAAASGSSGFSGGSSGGGGGGGGGGGW